jgi:hypothetical protein
MCVQCNAVVSYSDLDEPSVSIFIVEFEDSRFCFHCKSEPHHLGCSSKSSDLYGILSQFESQPAYQLASRRRFVFFISPSRQLSGYYIKLAKIVSFQIPSN